MAGSMPNPAKNKPNYAIVRLKLVAMSKIPIKDTTSAISKDFLRPKLSFIQDTVK